MTQKTSIPEMPIFDEEPWFNNLPTVKQEEVLENRKVAVAEDILGMTELFGEYFPQLVQTEPEMTEAFVRRLAVGRVMVYSQGIQDGINYQSALEQYRSRDLAQFRSNVLGNE